MYEIISKTENKRVYKSSITGTEVTTICIYTNEAGEKWWAFEDLLNIPLIRKKAAEKLTNLYGAGITKDDLEAIVQRLKEILKGSDKEKYERAYSEVLQIETMMASVADPVKQSLSLCSVYILSDAEQIDVFSFNTAKEKMDNWALDLKAQSFFLQWLTDGMSAYTKLYEQVSEIVSITEK